MCYPTSTIHHHFPALSMLQKSQAEKLSVALCYRILASLQDFHHPPITLAYQDGLLREMLKGVPSRWGKDTNDTFILLVEVKNLHK